MSSTKDKVFLEIAVTLGQLGTCDRAKVGAVITRGGRAISWGYNGAPPGMPHCDENKHGWWSHLTPDDIRNAPPEIVRAWEEGAEEGLWEQGCRNATHAEANAIAFAARQGISTDGGTLYVERSPCDTCARLCVAAGIARVVCFTMYRDDTGRQLLESAGIPVEFMEDSNE